VGNDSLLGNESCGTPFLGQSAYCQPNNQMDAQVNPTSQPAVASPNKISQKPTTHRSRKLVRITKSLQISSLTCGFRVSVRRFGGISFPCPKIVALELLGRVLSPALPRKVFAPGVADHNPQSQSQPNACDCLQGFLPSLNAPRIPSPSALGSGLNASGRGRSNRARNQKRPPPTASIALPQIDSAAAGFDNHK